MSPVLDMSAYYLIPRCSVSLPPC